MKISVVITNHNGEEILREHFPYVMAAKENSINRIEEIIIVDDASTDGSIDYLSRFKAKDKSIRILKNSVNKGFSFTTNKGVRFAKSGLVCLLNNDVSPENNFLKSIFGIFKDPDVFAVSLHEKGYGPATARFLNGFIHHLSGVESNKVSASFWASGGSCVVRKKLWRELGGLDTELLSPYYWEDIDIAYRARKRGWKVLWDPNANVFHEHEATIGKKSKKKVRITQERNELLVHWKNITSNQLFRKHLIGLVARIIKHPGYLRIVFAALGKYRLVIQRRITETKESKVSDESIFSQLS